MTINRTHLAGLELALDEMHLMLDGSCEARLNRLIAQAQEAPEAEPVEVVAWMKHELCTRLYFHAPPDPSIPLMTVAQHNRIMAIAPQHDAELIELLRDCYPGCGLTARQTAQLRERIDAKLAALKVKP